MYVRSSVKATKRFFPRLKPTCSALSYNSAPPPLALAPLVQSYKDKVASGEMTYDRTQLTAVKYLQALDRMVMRYDASILASAGQASSVTGLSRQDEDAHIPVRVQLKQHDDSDSTRTSPPTSPNEASKPERIRGMYIYGPVGTGKTMVMDLFFKNSQVEKKRRVHFHKFMLEIHKRIHDFKQRLLQAHGPDVHVNLSSERDAIVQVAKAVSSEARLLCFDELQVTDICDAMILRKLFGELWSCGTVLVATSNRPPQDLYKDGLNRGYFMPLIDHLERECLVYNMCGEKDYRLESVASLNTVYHTPLSETSTGALWLQYQSFSKLPASLPPVSSSPASSLSTRHAVTIPVMMGRKFTVGSGCLLTRVCWIEFTDLCESDVGAADYQSICKHFTTICLNGIPKLDVRQHDTARRFITFIDEVYDAKVRLLWTAQCVPQDLFNDLLYAEEHGEQDSEIPVMANEKRTLVENSIRGSNTETFSVNRTVRVDAAQEELRILQGELASIQELGFAFKRASSRMVEMAGQAYQMAWEELNH